MLNTTEIPNPFPPEPVIKVALKKTPAYSALRYWRNAKAVRQWVASGYPIPMPKAAQFWIVEQYARRFQPPIFLETGTLKGEMIDAMRRYGGFEQLHSIELQPTLAKLARERFRAYRHIRIHHGNSAEVLPFLLSQITSTPVLFWLDGHYSGEFTASADEESPVRHELHAVLAHARQHDLPHVVLIDNANFFNGTNGYATIPEVTEIVRQYRPQWSCTVEHDVIRIHR